MADLRSLVLDLCRRAGLDATAADATQVWGRVPGMVLASRMTVRAALEALQQAHAFDAVESDGRMAFRGRRGAAVAALTRADLVPDRDGNLLNVTRRQETELPRQIDVIYAAVSAAHQASTQSACRGTGAARGVISVELPLALQDDQARAVAERLLYAAWLERDVHRFVLSAVHARLEPGDVVSLDMRGRVQRLRITATETQAGAVHVTAVPDDAARQTAAPGGAGGVKRSTLRQPAQTVLFALDLPLLRDVDDGPGWYVAASYDAGVPGTVWRGAVVLQSLDGGASYDTLATLSTPATWGLCESVLAAGPATHWDEASVLRVRIRHGALESRGVASVLQGANAALVGREILQFRQAVLQPDGTYVLSGLLRGRRGTEHEIAGHGPGETFLLLRAPDLRRMPAHQELVGTELRLKAVTLGTHAEDAAGQPFVNRAAGLRPWSVAHPRGGRDGAGGDWSITWVRRSRFGAGWIDHADVALGEESERYELDILDSGGGVRRTLRVDGAAAVYTAAMQAEDFGGPQPGLRLRIHQISATLGRGLGREVTL